MPTLHVRNVPDGLYERLRQRALAEDRSLSAEVLTLLELAIERPPEARAALFDRIQRRRAGLFQTVGQFPSSADLIRENRDR